MVDRLDFRPSRTSGASPTDSPYLDRAVWNAYKSYSRGQLGGIMIGAIVGLGLGVATGGLAWLGTSTFFPVAAATIEATFAGGLAGAATLAGAGIMAATTKYYYDVFKNVGGYAGAAAAVMEIAEERQQEVNIKLDTILNLHAAEGKISPEEIRDIENQIEDIYKGGEEHFENKFDGKKMFWKVAAVGAVAGVAIVGAILTGGAAVATLAGAKVALDVTLIAAGSTALLGGALGGATYGINRQYYRNWMNVAYALYEGRTLKTADSMWKRQTGQMREPDLSDFVQLTDRQRNKPTPQTHFVSVKPKPPGGYVQAYLNQKHEQPPELPNKTGNWQDLTIEQSNQDPSPEAGR